MADAVIQNISGIVGTVTGAIEAAGKLDSSLGDQEGASIGGSNGPRPFSTDRNHETVTHSYSRTFFHGIGNNMDFTGLQFRSLGDQTAQYDEGYHFVPYRYLIASATPRQINAHMQLYRAMRIKSIGFKIFRLQFTKENFSTGSTFTNVSNNYAEEPCMQMFRDDNHLFDELHKPKDRMKYWEVNDMMTSPWLPNYAQMQLVRSIFELGKEYFEADDLEAYGTAWNRFNLINDFNVSFMSKNQEYAYNWNNPLDNWYSVAPYSKSTKNKSADQVNTLDPCLNPFIDENGDMAEIGCIEARELTGTNQNILDTPVNHFIKINPYVTSNGVINLEGLIMIKYWSELEWMVFPHAAIPRMLRSKQDINKLLAGYKQIRHASWTLNRPRALSKWQKAFQYTVNANIDST